MNATITPQSIQQQALKVQAEQLELNRMIAELQPLATELERLYSIPEIAELLNFGVDKTRELCMFADKMTPEEVASIHHKIQKTKIGREERVSARAYKAFVEATQGQKVETTQMSRKAKVKLNK